MENSYQKTTNMAYSEFFRQFLCKNQIFIWIVETNLIGKDLKNLQHLQIYPQGFFI
jgi:hypothetical protein